VTLETDSGWTTKRSKVILPVERALVSSPTNRSIYLPLTKTAEFSKARTLTGVGHPQSYGKPLAFFLKSPNRPFKATFHWDGKGVNRALADGQ
jgi:hypothetical protein